MITAGQLVAHAVGDYLLQSDWMATEKTKRSVAALCHVLTYALPFLFLDPSPLALLAIVASHFAIDRWRLARYVVWAKNWLAPWGRGELVNVVRLSGTGICVVKTPRAVPPNKPWSACKATGYDPDRPQWMTVWLLIIADNTLHVLCNAIALRWL